MAVIDDLGYGDVGWKHPQVKSPALDELAREGVILNRHYAYHVCGPSRASLLSGRLPVHSHQYNWAPVGPDRRMTLLPEVLGRAGYRTAAVGKWDVGYLSSGHLPSRRGFDKSYVMLGTHADHWSHRGLNLFPQLDPTAPGRLDLWEDERPARVPCPGGEGRYYPDCKPQEQEHSCHLFSRKARELVSFYKAEEAPLFLYLAWTENHEPYDSHHTASVAGDHHGGLGADTTEMDVHASQAPDGFKPPHYNACERGPEIKKKFRAVQRGMLACVDEGVANLTQALEQNRYQAGGQTVSMWERTLMLFTSDNGAPSRLAGNNYPLRGGKATLFEGGMRVLAFVAGGFLPPSAPRRVDALLHAADWYGTFARLAGSEEAWDDRRAAEHGLPGIDSFDAWPLLSGAPNPPARQELLLSYVAHTDMGHRFVSDPNVTEIGKSVAFIQGRYKVVGRDRVDGKLFAGVNEGASGGGIEIAPGAAQMAGWTSRSSCEPLAVGGADAPVQINELGHSYGKGAEAMERAALRAAGKPYLLFDLEADPGEHRDLSAQRPELLARLVKRMDALGQSAYQRVMVEETEDLWCLGPWGYQKRFGDAAHGPMCVSGADGAQLSLLGRGDFGKLTRFGGYYDIERGVPKLWAD
jgi:arylsulfatase I/J